MRRTMSSWSASFTMAGAVRVLLSSVSMTSAMLLAGRVRAPEKMKASISLPRICLAEVSPITHLSASTRFDLPQPLGPTMPVMPGSMASSVGSTKDLKPESRSLSNCTIYTTLTVCLFDELAEHAVEFLDRSRAGIELTVDDERRRRVDAQRLAALIVGDHRIAHRLVGEAGLDLVLAHAGDAQRLGELGDRVGGGGPGRLAREDEIDHAEIAVLAGALGDLGRLGGHLIEREIAVDQLHLAGVDPLPFDRWQDLRAEMGAVRTGERGILDHRDRGVGVAQHMVAGQDGQQGGLVGGRRRRGRQRAGRSGTGAEIAAKRTRGHRHDAAGDNQDIPHSVFLSTTSWELRLWGVKRLPPYLA